MTDTFTLDVDQASELKHAAKRNGVTNADLKALSTGDMFAKILPILRGRAEAIMKPILSFLRAEAISAQPAVTTSKHYFEEAGVRWMGKSFESQFFGLEVGVVDEAVLSIHKLDKNSLDEPILAELGDKAELTLSQFKEFLSKNRKSEESFFFYMKGKDGELWVVYAFWNTDGDSWEVSAGSPQNLSGWEVGALVVSRK